MARLVQLTDFWSPAEAATAVSALSAAGIFAVCPDYHTFHYRPWLGLGATACRVMVPESELVDAADIIGVKTCTEHRTFPCPECGGASLKKRNWWITIPYFLTLGFVTAYGFGRDFWLKRGRKCIICCHEWLPELAEPMTEAELGYPPESPSLQEIVLQYFDRFMALRKL